MLWVGRLFVRTLALVGLDACLNGPTMPSARTHPSARKKSPLSLSPRIIAAPASILEPTLRNRGMLHSNRARTAAGAELLDESGVHDALEADQLRLDAGGLQRADYDAARQALADRENDVARARRDLLEDLARAAASVRARHIGESAAERQCSAASCAAHESGVEVVWSSRQACKHILAPVIHAESIMCGAGRAVSRSAHSPSLP